MKNKLILLSVLLIVAVLALVVVSVNLQTVKNEVVTMTAQIETVSSEIEEAKLAIEEAAAKAAAAKAAEEAAAAKAAEEAVLATDAIHIVYSNDSHCHINTVIDDEDGMETIGTAGIAAYRNHLKETNAYVTLVDAGDFIQGAPAGAMSTGQFIIDAYNAAKYDVVTIGNHEFDYQIPRMFELMDGITADVISSNFVDLATGKPVYDPYVIYTYGDVKVAYVGIATPESYTKSTPTYFKDKDGNFLYTFGEKNNSQDMYDYIQAAVDAARAEGANYVIAVAHLGVEETSSPWRSTDVVAATTGIDVVIDGHSHTVVEGDLVKNKEGKDVLVTQAGEYYDYIGTVTITPADGTIKTTLISAKDFEAMNLELDPIVLAELDRINAELDPLLEKVVASSSVPLAVNDPTSGERIIRNHETNLGDLVADAYRTLMDTDVAIVNGGGIRADLPAGDITFNQVISVHPFGNQATSLEVTGQMIKDALENGAKNSPGESGGFLQVSGLTFTIDSTIPSSIKCDEQGAFLAVEGEYRVRDIMIGDKPLDVNATYSLASHDYMLLNAGDGMTMFKDAKLLKDKFMIDNEVLINYIKDHLNGVVGEEYAETYGQGRITIIK